MTNREGLTLAEWLAAAGILDEHSKPHADRKALVKAWRLGEDPTEYRVAK